MFSTQITGYDLGLEENCMSGLFFLHMLHLEQ